MKISEKNRSLRHLIVGAGPAGIMAALALARSGQRVTLLEGEETVAKKILLTGGGRCNLSHQAPVSELVEHYYGQGRFLYPSLQNYGPSFMLDLFAEAGLPTRVEADGRVYPQSHRAADVQKTFLHLLQHPAITLVPNSKVRTIQRTEDGYLVSTSREQYLTETLILCCGGSSYPKTGSDGSGYRLLEDLGLPLIPPHFALSAIDTQPNWGETLQGLSLIETTVFCKVKKKTHAYHGGLMITAKGLSGLPILNLSYYQSSRIYLDLQPRLKLGHWEELMLCEKRREPRLSLEKAFQLDLPKRLIHHLLQEEALAPALPLSELKDQKIRQLLAKWKAYPFEAVYSASPSQAQVTAGGLALTAVHPQQLCLRNEENLFVAGELLDLCGECGGYNLLAACASGYAAGVGASQRKRTGP